MVQRFRALATSRVQNVRASVRNSVHCLRQSSHASKRNLCLHDRGLNINNILKHGSNLRVRPDLDLACSAGVFWVGETLFVFVILL